MIKKISIFFIVIIIILNIPICGYCNENQEQNNNIRIEINIPYKTLCLVKNEEIIKKYPIAVGKPISQTPIGSYKVIQKIVDPYYAKKRIPGGSEKNPLGSRWISFKPSYGIHGNNNPNSIGTYASGGCIRMYERDVQELYDIVNLDTNVDIVYETVKLRKDYEGLNSIVIVKSDYYNKGVNNKDKIDLSIKDINIDDEKIGKLKKLIDKQEVVFSKDWTFFINGEYITNDVLIENNNAYINELVIQRYFNIEVNSVNNSSMCYIDGKKAVEKEYKGQKYVLLDDVKKIIGGKYIINKLCSTIKYQINYLLINDTLVKGKLIDIWSNPKFSAISILKVFNAEMAFDNGKLIMYMPTGEEIEVIIEDELYIEVEKFAKIMNLSCEVFTYDKHIELSKEPIIICNNTIYYGKKIKGEIYIPCDIFIDELDYKEYINDYIYINFQKVYLKNLDGIRHIRLEDIDSIIEVHSDKYRLKILLDKKVKIG